MYNYSPKEDYLLKLIKSYKTEKLGIPDISYTYHKVNDNQNQENEFIKTEIFLNWLVKNNSEIFDINDKIMFINYGDTELVYVADCKEHRRTLLIGQPNIEFGSVKKEYENLIKLAKNNPSLVVCPTNYFCHENREAFLTPYFYQARCIASIETGYGQYVPEPNYHFELYNDNDAYTICKAIITNLILLYNDDEKFGLKSCKVGGGDFILAKEYDYELHSIDNTLKRMHLIAARDFIYSDLNDYINLLREEFVKNTYYKKESERDPKVLINCKNSRPMLKEAIEDGIHLGLSLK